MNPTLLKLLFQSPQMTKKDLHIPVLYLFTNNMCSAKPHFFWDNNYLIWYVQLLSHDMWIWLSDAYIWCMRYFLVIHTPMGIRSHDLTLRLAFYKGRAHWHKVILKILNLKRTRTCHYSNQKINLNFTVEKYISFQRWYSAISYSPI